MAKICKPLLAAALNLGTGITASSAAAGCGVGSLQGSYAFKVTGKNVGVFDSTGALHPFASPLLVNGAGYFIFDGNGSLTKIDYNVGNGTPSISPAIPLTSGGFRTGQTGTYGVDADCTGTLTFNVPGGRVVTLALAVVSNGQGIFGVVKAEHAPFLPSSVVPSGASCESGCDLGDNISLEFTKNTWRQQ